MRTAIMSVVPITLLAGSAAIAQPAPTIAVQMSNFKFAPTTIVLDHGRSYVLHLANVSGGGHDFTAPAFFAAANVAPADRHYIVEGVVEVPSGKAIDIHLTAGRGPLQAQVHSQPAQDVWNERRDRRSLVPLP